MVNITMNLSQLPVPEGLGSELTLALSREQQLGRGASGKSLLCLQVVPVTNKPSWRIFQIPRSAAVRTGCVFYVSGQLLPRAQPCSPSWQLFNHIFSLKVTESSVCALG